jgi:zinc transport system substrate-binding protein
MKMIVMIRARRLPALAASAALLLAAGCGTGTAGTGAGSSATLEVVTAFYPFQFVAERVAGPHASVSSLTQPGAEPHDLELTPRQVGSLSTADLVVYERTFQPAVDEAVAQSGAADVLDTASVVPLEPLGGAAHMHEGEHSADDGHDHGDLDPHVWLDPTQLATIATEVSARLATLDAVHAADYRANAAALTAELDLLDGEFRTGLAHCERTEFVTTHAAFGYLARRYGLSQIAISGLSPDAEPSPARVAAVQREAQDHGVTTIFSETLVSPAMADAIAGDLGLRTDVLDPVEGITDASRGPDYLAVMRANLVALRQAGGCA